LRSQLWELALPAMAASQPTNPFQLCPVQLWEILWLRAIPQLTEYISVAAVTAAYGFALTASHF